MKNNEIREDPRPPPEPLKRVCKPLHSRISVPWQDDFSLQGLKQIYENVQQVNRAIVERLRAASEADSVLNAIVILDTYAQTIPCMIEDSLDSIRYLFSPYLTDNDSSAGNP